MIGPFTLDATVAVAWCFVDEATERTAALLTSMKHRKAVVPGLWHFETASLLVRAERRGRITEPVLAAFLGTLARLPIETDAEAERRAHTGQSWLSPVLTLSHHMTHAYLDLAVRRALPLATRDRDLIRAAERCGVPLIET